MNVDVNPSREYTNDMELGEKLKLYGMNNKLTTQNGMVSNHNETIYERLLVLIYQKN